MQARSMKIAFVTQAILVAAQSRHKTVQSLMIAQHAMLESTRVTLAQLLAAIAHLLPIQVRLDPQTNKIAGV